MTHEHLSELLGVDMETTLLLVQVFEEEFKEDMSRLHSAILSRNYHAIEDAAHAIKGSSSNMRYDDIADVAREIEQAAIARDETFMFLERYEMLEMKAK